MRPIPALLVLFALSMPVAAQDVAAMPDAEAVPGEELVFAPVEAGELTLDEFLWLNRIVVVFADTPRDPSFMRQIDLLRARPEALEDRDIVVLTDTDPAARSSIRTSLRPRGFAVVIVDKDGRVLQRKPSPWDVREISRAIDKTPLRQQELREMRDIEAERRGLPR